jgi:L-lysine exporter family protein LysE/ArgO
VGICALSDVVLITAGVAGIGGIVERAPWVLEVVRWLGVAFLTWYGVSSLLRARRAETLHAADRVTVSRRGVAVRALALTWLNPHVYLDTVLLLGTIANQHGSTGRWWFAVGACIGSLLWFSGLGFGARYASRWLARPRAWQVLDVLIGVTMIAIAASLAVG